MDEFELIRRYFQTGQSIFSNEVDVGIGDDAAVINVPEGMALLVSTDTLVSNVHFLENWSADIIGYRALVCNISDIVAMGGQAKWVSLALTLPILDEQWLEAFSGSIKATLDTYDIILIGGDTTQGPLSITVTIHGVVPKGQAVLRSGAKPGDLIYVTGTLGAPALAVSCLTTNTKLDDPLFKKLTHPLPRVEFIDTIREFASSAIDISDGLSADLFHVLRASGVGAKLHASAIPLDPLVAELTDAWELAVNSGDEYEICFTVPHHLQSLLVEKLAEKQLSVTCIGKITDEVGLTIKLPDGKVTPYQACGYKHF